MEDVRQGVAEENEMNASEEATSTRASINLGFLSAFVF